jgi:hypothetical protein
LGGYHHLFSVERPIYMLPLETVLPMHTEYCL